MSGAVREGDRIMERSTHCQVRLLAIVLGTFTLWVCSSSCISRNVADNRLSTLRWTFDSTADRYLVREIVECRLRAIGVTFEALRVSDQQVEVQLAVSHVTSARAILAMRGEQGFYPVLSTPLDEAQEFRLE